MQAVFATTEFARPKLAFLPEENTGRLGVERARLAAMRDRTKALMDSYGDPKREGFPPEQYEALKVHQKHMDLYRLSIDRYEAMAFAVSSGPRDGETDGGPTLKYPPRSEYAAPKTHVLIGGSHEAPGEAVSPGVLSALGFEAKMPLAVEGRRAALAQWLTDERNPLLARVMANRIWQWHFGEGIAANANNFGVMGAKPKDMALLDGLAWEFRQSGYDIQALQRKIVLSDYYQSERAAPRRLEAEALRDSMLAAAGVLNLELGGPGVFPEINEDVARQPQHRMGSLAPPYFPSPEKAQRYRRSLYTFQQRTLIDPLIEVFNGANPDSTCERREASTVPTQAFALFNSQFAHTVAMEMALRLEREGATVERRIERAFALTLQRKPSAAELELSLKHYERLIDLYRKQPVPLRRQRGPVVHAITSELTGETFRFTQLSPETPYEPSTEAADLTAEQRALTGLALSLMNTNEFVYVE